MVKQTNAPPAVHEILLVAGLDGAGVVDNAATFGLPAVSYQV